MAPPQAGKQKRPTSKARRRPAPLAAAGIALLVAGSLAGGVYEVIDTRNDPRRTAAGDTSEVPPTAPPSGPVTNVADAGQVAPLRRVVPPDVLAVRGGGGSITRAQIAKIAKLAKVRDVVAVSGGAVQLQGRSINTFAVDPSSFRSWTPPGTAKKTDLWTALAADQFVVSATAAEQLQLARGFQYPIVARTMPSLTMGGAGTLGLPGIDMLVSRKTGTDLGLVPNVAVMVNAPGANPAKVVKGVGKVLGAGANVVNLHERKYQAPADGGRPGSYMDLYRQAATTCPGLSWTVLAAIGQVESDHGRNAGRSSAGALGPMQFMPATWRAYGVDGDRDGKADIMNPYDAVPGAAKYLCANGAGKGGKQLYRAIWHYNHADWYVQKVLALARAYAARFR
ncbi:lytic transglycosylase domain-containing protein [Spirillospora sp. NPDC048911]|uniref:lytic transglycosylase domain-containing protein n=1 Tax=Spirillospora sp. NPDC048911 TaxID=3364527 RepID=UPI003714AE10